MKVKTADLIGPALDWAVAKCEGYGGLRRNPHAFDQALIMNRWDGQCVRFSALKYTTDWSQGGPILEREVAKLIKNLNGTYTAQIRHEQDHPLIAHKVLAGWTNRAGPTPLVAAMRCFVASKLGDEIEVPEELL